MQFLVATSWFVTTFYAKSEVALPLAHVRAWWLEGEIRSSIPLLSQLLRGAEGFIRIALIARLLIEAG